MGEGHLQAGASRSHLIQDLDLRLPTPWPVKAEVLKSPGHGILFHGILTKQMHRRLLRPT